MGLPVIVMVGIVLSLIIFTFVSSSLFGSREDLNLEQQDFIIIKKVYTNHLSIN